MELCTLKKSPDGGYDKASIKQLRQDIADAFNKVFENVTVNGVEHYSKLPSEIKKALYHIGDTWNNTQINEIAAQVEKFIRANYEDLLDPYLPAQGIKYTLSKRYREIFGTVHSAEEYFEQEDIEEADRMPSQFFDDAFGNLAKIKNELKQKVTHKLLSTFIIDRENGRIVTDITTANINARATKQKLFENAVTIWAASLGRKLPDDLTLFRPDGTYTGILDTPEIKNLVLASGYHAKTPAQLQAMYDAQKTSPSREYEAFTDWFTLMNYDNFVKLLLGDAITVNPRHRGKFIDGDAYDYSSKGGNLITSYRTNENIDLYVEINKLAQSLINSTPFLKAGTTDSTGKYIKFEDFFRLTTKIKDLVLDPRTSNIVFTALSKELLNVDPIDRKYVEGKSLRQIINSIRTNPQIYAKLTFLLLTPEVMSDLGFTDEELDKVWSIYKGIFDANGDSINAIQSKYDHRALNYYNMLTQLTDSIFSVDFLLYYENEGTIQVHPLRDQSANNIQRNLEATINSQNSRRVLQDNYEQNQMRPWLAKAIKVEEKPTTGIMFTVGDIEVVYDDLNTGIIKYSKDGKQLLDVNLASFANNDKVIKFIDELLHLDLQGDHDLVEAMNIIFKGQYLPQLMNLATRVYFNKYLSNVDFKTIKGYSGIQAALKGVYNDSEWIPSYNGQLNEINLISSKDTAILENIANAKMITTGEAQSTQVRDAENNMLSTLTTSRLLGGLASLHERIRTPYKDQNGMLRNNAASHFSYLRPGIYKGHYASKEYKSAINSKLETGFTVSEFMHGAFIYDFVGGFVANNSSSKKLFSNGTVSFYPSVNSDKGTMGRIVVDLTKTIEIGPHTGKTFKDLTAEEADEQTAFELGQYYEQMHAKVVDDFKRLHDFVLETEHIDIDINPDDDFGALNNYCQNPPEGVSKTSADKWLYERTLKYNTLHPTHPILLIDQTHFIKDKANKGCIMYNPTTQILRRRYKNPQFMKHFMDLKRAELLSGLLKENFSVDLFDEPTTTNGTTPKKWLQLNYGDWVHSFLSYNGKMAIAKLTYKGKTFNITSKADLVEFTKYVVQGNYTLFLDKPHELLNPKYGIQVEVHPMLSKYNSLDYLFTLEHMIAGVGTHANHPSKAKTKAPIVWGHPAIGKTFSVKDGKYADKIIDWDVEFNRRRDAWIANATNTEIGTEEFKDARNQVLVGYSKSHPESMGHPSPLFWQLNNDFKKFVTTEWNRVKAKANHQHKMLVASPSMLLDMFAGDFTTIIDMDREDFIKRGIERGDSDPAGWKDGIDRAMDRYIQKYETLESGARSFKTKIKKVKPGEYLEDMLDNGSLYDELSTLDDNEMLEESARFLAQHKRNVSYTAAMHEFLLNLVDGIPATYNMAMIKGVPAWVYTISGDVKDDQDAFDGATFVNPLVVIWENNSLKGNKAGIDKKQFVHFYDEATGTGGIIKTAGFGCTNDRARRYKFYRDMMWNMMKRDWIDADGSPLIIKPNGILEDFNGNKVDYGTFYFKLAGKNYARRILKYNGDNTYEVEDTLLNDDDTTEINVHSTGPITSNYDMWQMFGGERSLEMDENGELQYSENSIDLTARAANNYGIKREGVDKVRSAEDVFLPMKHSDIHYMPTDGAVKQGASNINSEDKFFRRMTPTALARQAIQSGLPHDSLNIMRVKMTQAGIQLDKEHHADKAVLSLMTQVISAASAKSFMPFQQNGLKTALNELTKLGTRNFRDELGKMHLRVNGDIAKFDAAVTDIIMDTVLNSTQSDGTLMVSIAKRLKSVLGNDFTISEKNSQQIDKYLPYSSPEIFHKIVSALTVALTKRGIKTKMPGVLSVLCPTHEIVKFYKIPIDPKHPENGFKKVTLEAAEDYFYANGSSTFEVGSLQWLEENLDLLQDTEKELVRSNKGLITPDVQATNIGYKYLVTLTDGTKMVVRIVKPNKLGISKKGVTTFHGEQLAVNDLGYLDLVDLNNTGAIQSIKEWNKDGLDLNAYNVRFNDSEGNSWQLGDLEIVQDYFNFKEIDDEKLSDSEKENKKLDTLRKLLAKYNAAEEFKNRIINTLNRAWKDDMNNPRKQIIDKLITKAPLDFNDPLVAQVAQQYRNFVLKMGTSFLNRRMLIELNGISPTATDSITVRVQGKEVQVNKNSIKVQSYGIIMPKVFASNLGLDPFDNIEDIKNDPLFFTKKLVKRFGTKVETGYPIQRFNDDGTVKQKEDGTEDVFFAHNYDVEFKRMDGKHVYVKVGMDNADFGPLIEWNYREDGNGHIFRVDSNNNNLGPMFSVNDKIFLDHNGNEIIVTSEDHYEFLDEHGNVVPDADVSLAGEVYVNTRTGEQVYKHGSSGMKFYMDNLSYNTININTQKAKSFTSLLGLAEASTNKKANIYASILGKITDEKARRKFAKKMNDYSGLLSDDGLIRGNMGRILSELGREMHTSFMRSLNIIAARIPAQNQQSFMPMECLAYDNPNINTAYVSIFQFFLQGSDLDIDAVSLQTFDIDKNGIYLGHSPYYNLDNMELRKLSEQLPFPTGVETETKLALRKEDHFMETHFELFGPSGSNALFILSRNNKGLIRAALNVDGSDVDTNIEDDYERGKAEIRLREVAKENLVKMAKLIDEINADGLLSEADESTLKEIAEHFNTTIFGATNGEQLITADDIPMIMQQIKKAIDKHNLYLKKANPKLLESIVKNYAITQLFNIIEDPINLLEAQSSVDTVTGPVKELSKSSPKATVQGVFTPGCVLNKFQSVNENMVGKDGISICATGLKSFFGITDLYQNVLNGNDKLAKDDLLFNVTIGGRTYHGLANGFATRFKSIWETSGEDVNNDEYFSLRVLDYLLEQLWEDDAANGMSAFLGLSTDNAKELVLAKINAGTSTMGMYLYGLSIGIPTSTLYLIMTTPLAFRLAELTKGDVFNLDSGQFSILNAINYLYSEPNLGQYDPYDWELGVTSPLEYVTESIRKRFNIETPEVIKTLNKFITSLNLTQLTGRIKKILEEIRQEIVGNIPAVIATDSVKSMHYQIAANKIIDFIKLYIDDVNLTKQNVAYSTIYGEANLFDDLEKLAMGAEEMKMMGKNLSLNQGIKTNPSDLIKLVKNIENLAVKRINIIKRYAERHPEDTWANSFKEAKANDYIIDFEKFMTDPRYQEWAITTYDKLKASYNPLKVIKEVKHYNGYFESLLLAYKGIERKSLKWKALTIVADGFITNLHVSNSQLADLVYKNTEREVDSFLRDEWFKAIAPRITIPASTPERMTKIFISSNRAVDNRYSREIMLGTPLGNANYKMYMDSVVIPELKRLYPDNKFIRSLSPVINTSTNLGTISVAYGLPINMMPKSEYERDVFNEMKDGFAQLSDKLYNDRPILDMLYYYSMIAFNGRVGPRSLHGIFEDYDGAPIKTYHEFVSNADLDKDGLIWEKFLRHAKNFAIAPFSSVSRGGSDVFKVKNKNNDTIEVWVKYNPSEDELRMYEMNPELEPYNRNGYAQSASINPNANYNFFSEPVTIDTVESVDTAVTINGTSLSIRISFTPIVRKGKVVGMSMDNIDTTELVKKDADMVSRLKDIMGDKTNGVNPAFLVFTPDGLIVDKNAIIDHLKNECVSSSPF